MGLRKIVINCIFASLLVLGVGVTFFIIHYLSDRNLKELTINDIIKNRVELMKEKKIQEVKQDKKLMSELKEKMKRVR